MSNLNYFKKFFEIFIAYKLKQRFSFVNKVLVFVINATIQISLSKQFKKQLIGTFYFKRQNLNKKQKEFYFHK